MQNQSLFCYCCLFSQLCIQWHFLKSSVLMSSSLWFMQRRRRYHNEERRIEYNGNRSELKYIQGWSYGLSIVRFILQPQKFVYVFKAFQFNYATAVPSSALMCSLKRSTFDSNERFPSHCLLYLTHVCRMEWRKIDKFTFRFKSKMTPVTLESIQAFEPHSTNNELKIF